MNEPGLTRPAQLRLLIALDRVTTAAPDASVARLQAAPVGSDELKALDPVLSGLFLPSPGADPLLSEVRQLVRTPGVRSRKMLCSTAKSAAFAEVSDAFVLHTMGQAAVGLLVLDVAWKDPASRDDLLTQMAALRTRSSDDYAVEVHERADAESVTALGVTDALRGRGRYRLRDFVDWLLYGTGFAVRSGGSHVHMVAVQLSPNWPDPHRLALELARGVEPAQTLPVDPEWATTLRLRADRTVVVTRSGASSVCWGGDQGHEQRFVSKSYFWSAACVHLERLSLAQMSRAVGEQLANRSATDGVDADRKDDGVDEALTLARGFLRVAVALSVEDPGGEQEVGEFHRTLRQIYSNRELLAELREEVRELVQIADARTAREQNRADRESAEKERAFERRVAGFGAIGVALAWFTGTLGMNVNWDWTAAGAPNFAPHVTWLLATLIGAGAFWALWVGGNSNRS